MKTVYWEYVKPSQWPALFASTKNLESIKEWPIGAVNWANRDFLLSQTPKWEISVDINWVTQDEWVDYTVTWTLLRFSIPPYVGDDINVYYVYET